MDAGALVNDPTGVIVCWTWLGLLVAVSTRVVWRRRSVDTECETCSYDLRGLPDAAVCPECGTARAPVLRDAARVEFEFRERPGPAYATALWLGTFLLVSGISVSPIPPAAAFPLWLYLIWSIVWRPTCEMVPCEGSMCHRCRYDMTGHAYQAACPECGTPRAAAERPHWRFLLQRDRILGVLLAVIIGIGSIIIADTMRLTLLQASFDQQVGVGRAVATAYHASVMKTDAISWGAMFLPLLVTLPRRWPTLALLSATLLGWVVYLAVYIRPFV